MISLTPDPDLEPDSDRSASSSDPGSPKPAAGPDFGIQNAMELMRKLPPDNVPLVVGVVKTTLESLHVDVGSIIQEAKAKRAKIATRISGLEAEIAELEEEMGARREEIKALRDDDAETQSVQQRLEMTTKAPARQAAKDPIPSGFGFGTSEPSGPLLEPPGA
ncbi:MAG: hypothetical protein AB1Z98_26010 [Nannocystaceae bacterium]